MNLGSYIPNSTAGDERRSIAAGMRRAGEAAARPGAGHEEEQEWMVTYTDMVTLMLTLFVILISMSTFDDPGRPVSQDLDVDETRAPDLAPPLESILAFPEPDFGAADDLLPDLDEAPEELIVTSWVDRVDALLRNYLTTTDLAADVEIEKLDDRIIVHLRDQVLFQSGRADIGSRGDALLRRLAPMLQYLAIPVTVEGHTDDVPIRSGMFPSNWELSAARAAAVVRRLIAEGLPADRLSAVGYADTRPQDSNLTADGRARNRRVSLSLISAEADMPIAAGARP